VSAIPPYSVRFRLRSTLSPSEQRSTGNQSGAEKQQEIGTPRCGRSGPRRGDVGASGRAWIAPQATLNVWYPVPFTEPLEKNEPALSSAVTRIDELVDDALAAGIPSERIALGGFS